MIHMASVSRGRSSVSRSKRRLPAKHRFEYALHSTSLTSVEFLSFRIDIFYIKYVFKQNTGHFQRVLLSQTANSTASSGGVGADESRNNKLLID